MLRVDVAPNRSVSARTIIHHNISCVICFWNHSARNNKFQKGSGWPSDMFFLLKEFYSKPSKYKRHQNPMANCWSIIHGALHPTSFSSTTKVAGAWWPGLLPRSSLDSQLSITRREFPKKYSNRPLQHPQVPSKYKYETISSESWSIFCWTFLTFIWSHEVSC